MLSNQQRLQIIPVIDLKYGQVVFAQQGQRENYQPIKSKLTRSSNLLDILQAFIEIFAFPSFYIADLDALTHQGHHDDLITKAAQLYPNKEFWVDQGTLNSNINENLENILPVLGSESLTEDNYQQIKDFQKPFILSLDFATNGSVMGASKIYADLHLWSEIVIIMTLAKVGTQSGPDFQKLQHFRRLYPEKQFVAAGGIRNIEDIIILQKLGINQALIASALHSGAISGEDIQILQTKKYPGLD